MRERTYEVSDDHGRFDVSAAWKLLSQGASWGRWRDQSVVESQFRDAWRVLGAYVQGTGVMVGCARAVSDGVSIAYLADVYIDPSHRGVGLGAALIHAMVEEGPGKNFKWMLHTYDAHGLYQKYGFAAPDRTMMERPSPLAVAAAGYV